MPVVEVLVQPEEDEEVVIAVKDAAQAVLLAGAPPRAVRGRQRPAARKALLLLRLIRAVCRAIRLGRHHRGCLQATSAT